MSSSDFPAQSDLANYIIDRVNVGILVINSKHEITFWNEFMLTHSGKNAEDVLNKNLFDCFPEVPKRWFMKKLDMVFTLNNYAFISWEQRQYLFKFQHSRPITGGNVQFMAQNITLMPMEKANSSDEDLLCITVNDATDVYIYQCMLEEANHRLELSAQIDGLTQIYNRAYWERRLAESFGSCQRYDLPLTLAMLDLDHFKSINDIHGHLAGDEVIKFVSSSILETLREQDVFGRYGGEEFGVIFSNTGMEGALNVAERLRRLISESEIKADGKTLKVTVSVGLAEYHPSIDSYEKLISAADEALYQSKASGRNKVTVYRPE